MKYEKCLDCGQITTHSCDGPNLLSMEAVELGPWCNEFRKRIPGMTYDKVAAGTNVSKTAVHSFLNGSHMDCSYHTAHEIAKFIIGGNWDDNPCGNLSNSEKAAYEEKIRKLEADIARRDEKIKDLTANFDDMKTLVANTNKRNTEGQEFLRNQIKGKNTTIGILASLLTVSMVTVLILLIIFLK